MAAAAATAAAPTKKWFAKKGQTFLIGPEVESGENKKEERRVRLPFVISIFPQKTRCANKLFKLVTVHYFCATKFAQHLIWIKNKFCVRILLPRFTSLLFLSVVSGVCNVCVCVFCLHFSLNECAEAFEAERARLATATQKKKKRKQWKRRTQILAPEKKTTKKYLFMYKLSKMIGCDGFS